MQYTECTASHRAELYQQLTNSYQDYAARGLSLDLSRGKPGADQLDLSMPMLCDNGPYRSPGGIDCRNYGQLFGLPEMRAFWSDVTGIPADRIVVGGNSSLNLMYDTISRAMLFGLAHSPRPWAYEEKRKFLCPSPGYDRHFAITEALGFELITVPMTDEGPDMDLVEKLVKDDTVKGIWCVPKYANPTGITYSDRVVERLAAMQTGAPDFVIMWDNAYAVHDLVEPGDVLADIFAAAARYGHEDRVFYFTSSSKITVPGAGVSMLAASPAQLKLLERVMGTQTIGHDKLNQLRHLHFLPDRAAVTAHMKKHAAIIREKFELVLSLLERDLADAGVACWTKPNGGYFISLDVMPGTAKRVYELCRQAGVTLTAVGATFPYGKDPDDRNLRLAPTFPCLEELRTATEILTVSVRLAALEKLMAD